MTASVYKEFHRSLNVSSYKMVNDINEIIITYTNTEDRRPNTVENEIYWNPKDYWPSIRTEVSKKLST